MAAMTVRNDSVTPRLGATIDAKTDLVRMSLLGRGKLGDPAMEVFVRENPEHRWVYYPLLKPMEEALVMKQFQWFPALGEDQGQSYSCPLHVAFRDPSAPPESKEQVTGRHIYRFQVWLGDRAPPPLYKNKVRRNWEFQGGTISGGTDDEERVSDPNWSRSNQRARAAGWSDRTSKL